MKKILVVSTLLASFMVQASNISMSMMPATSAAGGGGSAGIINTGGDAGGSYPVSGAITAASNTQNLVINEQISMLGQMKAMQQQIQSLRNLVETQGHALDQLELTVMALQGQNSQNSNANQNVPTPSTVSPQTSPMISAVSSPATPAPTMSTIATTVAAPVTTSASSTDIPSNENKLYEIASQQVQDKNYTAAINSFKEYLQTYPKAKQAAEAHYWLGELYNIAGDDNNATTELTTVVSNYPQSTKAAEAMLQLGMMSYGAGQYDVANKWFTQVMTQYPNTTSASVAQKQLQQLQKAGY